MMHIKNTEWNSALLAAWRNNALMSRRRSDYGGFTLVIVISQRTRVATRVWEKIFIASLSLSLSLSLSRSSWAEYAPPLIYYSASRNVYTCRGFPIAGSYLPNHRYQSHCNIVHAEYRSICTSPVIRNLLLTDWLRTLPLATILL